MDKIGKALARLSAVERVMIHALLEKIARHDFVGLDIKKLKGRNDIFRVRKGDLRVLYRHDSNRIFLLAIERRSEKTYR